MTFSLENSLSSLSLEENIEICSLENKKPQNSATLASKEEPLTTSKKKSELIVFSSSPFCLPSDNNSSTSTSSLQENFKKFRQMKMNEKKLNSFASSNVVKDEKYKQELRDKFVKQALNYLNIPYSRKYEDKEANPEEGPLYLDCCGLVRKVMQDLALDFGFNLGKWNQAYMFDLLPMELSLEKGELKPGDLIFYEGKYVNKKNKKQIHDIVHIEIYLGENYGGTTKDSTVGARFRSGKISIFESYKFSSQLWDCSNIYFRSLDTWLNGVCQSCCPEHKWENEWLKNVEMNGKYSIFNDEPAENIEENGGGDESDEEESHAEKGQCVDSNGSDFQSTTTTSSSLNIGQRFSCETPSTEVNNKGISTAILGSSGDSSSSNPSSESNLKKSTKSYYVNKSNGWRLVKNSLDRHGWQQLPFNFNFSTRFNLKWMERRGDIDYKAHQPGQLVCHIPNNEIITTKIGLNLLIRDYYNKKNLDKIFSSNQSFSSNSSDDFKIPISPTLKTSSSFSTLPLSSTSTTYPSWFPITYDLEIVEDIIKLIEHAKRLDEEITIKSPENNSLLSVWIYKPPSNNRGRGIKLIMGEKGIKELLNGAAITMRIPGYFSEPVNSQSGSPNPGSSYVSPYASASSNSSTYLKGIVQRYLTEPLLVPPNKLKFDIRVYLLLTFVPLNNTKDLDIEQSKEITSNDNKELLVTSSKSTISSKEKAKNVSNKNLKLMAFYHPGYCRLAMTPYNLSKESINDVKMHLTNASIQKLEDDYQKNKQIQIQSIAQVSKSLEEAGLVDSSSFLLNELDDCIVSILKEVVNASHKKFLRAHGYFDLLGCDFMVTRTEYEEKEGEEIIKKYKHELKLLEINSNPALSLDNQVLEELLPSIVDQSIELVLKTQDSKKECSSKLLDMKIDEIIPPSDNHINNKCHAKGFQLIFKEE